MKHNGFEIKISDLLNGKITDTLSFERQTIPEIKNLTEEGISGTITLQSIDHESLLVTIDQLTCSLQEFCDRCGKSFIRKVEIERYTAKYVTEIDPSLEDSEEDMLLIDIKNGVIDLQEVIYHAIKLQEPFVLRCSECEKLPWEESEEWE